MANNRLYICNKSTGEYACIAKNYGGLWELGNKDLFIKIIESAEAESGEETDLILGVENDSEFDKKYLSKIKNDINDNGRWVNNWK